MVEIKLVLLKTGENIVSDLRPLYFDSKLTGYLLENPYSISYNYNYEVNNEKPKASLTFTKWPLLAKGTTIEVANHAVIAVSDPLDEIKDMYVNQSVEN